MQLWLRGSITGPRSLIMSPENVLFLSASRKLGGVRSSPWSLSVIRSWDVTYLWWLYTLLATRHSWCWIVCNLHRLITPSPRRPPTHRPRHCPARPRPPHQRRHQRCPEAHQRHCRTSPHYPPGVNKKWRVSSATLCLNDHRFWCCHLGEVMHPSKFENCGHAVEEAADDEPVQGRGIMNLNRRGCYRSLMTKT